MATKNIFKKISSVQKLITYLKQIPTYLTQLGKKFLSLRSLYF